MGNSLPKEEGPLSHKHTLLHYYVENKSTKEQCDVCNKEIYGLVYACEVCKFTRHGSCAQKPMPLDITHPSHPMHELKLRDKASDFLCEICFFNSRGPRYHCYDCLIDVDLACASSTKHQGDQRVRQIPEGRDRNRTRHFSHGEPLAFFKYRKTTQQYQLDCSWCDNRLTGMCYGCFKGGPYGCKFFLHQSCISKIPKKLFHPFHPQHYLHVQYSMYDYRFTCNACKGSVSTLSLTTYYACHLCSFYLHIPCARLQPTLKDKGHEHYLTYFRRSHYSEKSFNCDDCGHDCNKEGGFYRCVQCDFNIHFRCLPAPPMAKHRYHRHFLILHQGVIEDDSGEYYCDICEEKRHPKHHIYYCKKCTFVAHVECMLKEVSESEARKIMDIVKRVRRGNGNLPELKETAGSNNIDRNQLSEVQEIYLLLKDLHQEEEEMKKEKVKYFEGDEDAESSTSSDDDYNEDKEIDEEGSEVEEEEESEEEEDENEETSEEEEEVDSEEEESSEEDEYETKQGRLEEEEEEEGEEEEENEVNQGEELKSLIKGTRGEKKPALKIHHFSHKHPLNIFLLNEKYRKGVCNACCQDLRGTVYICKTCEFPFHYGLHKACTELPQELQHPFHPQHSLTLLPEFPYSESGYFLCDGCKDFSDGFVYHCMDCPFNLDVKCAVSAASDIESTQRPRHGEKESKLVHFSHKHVLVLGNLVDKSVSCLGCDLPIFGQAYSCLDCFYTIHECCIRILPQEIVQHPFHPFHPLVAFPEYSDNRKCHACLLDFRLDFPVRDCIRYGCLQCKFDLHFVCANSLRRVLKTNSHAHNLYYFGRDSQIFLESLGKLDGFNFTCSACSEMCNGPFYRCVDCAVNLHLKCVPVPQNIEYSKCHVHGLTLKDSFVDDDSGEYYCDVCEEKRHPKDHVYYCEECDGHFVAHIECILSMVGQTSPEIAAISYLESEFEKTSI